MIKKKMNDWRKIVINILLSLNLDRQEVPIVGLFFHQYNPNQNHSILEV
jgi:hypothetical protein